MSLAEYKRKRYFKRTPEPIGEDKNKPELQKKKPAGSTHVHKRLSFVVQKHQASHLHYDFRLEMRGVLKSWAVPKGPSMNPADKRLAMLVEDHPFEYKNFEGIIPEGNYGAGTVMIWDEGSYNALEGDEVIADKMEAEKILVKNFYSGKLRFELKGKKLKGKFTLVKAAERGETSWLLIKEKDHYAKESDITKKNTSVISRMTIEELAASKNARKWKSNRNEKTSSTPESDDPANEGTDRRSILKLSDESKDYEQIVAHLVTALEKKKKSPMPKDISPMMPSTAAKPFNDAAWMFEIKWDGYRALAYIHREKVELHVKGKKSLQKKFFPIYEALRQWNIKAIVDGEIVAVNEEGVSDKDLLEKWNTPADGELIFYVFDLLWLDGCDLRNLPLSERRVMLQQLVPEESAIHFSESFAVKGTEFFRSAKKLGISGMVAKKTSSTYKAGTTTKNWLVIRATDPPTGRTRAFTDTTV
jgi:bifunctional non-homologous end joining protein LigD